jgi:PIN domain nuclease of toxin-antitoxin system
MKSLLLDTHAALWAFQGSHDLSAYVVSLLNDGDVTIFVSPISAYEIVLKVNLGKLPMLPRPFAALAQASDFAILPVSASHYERAGQLALLNRDPWDRVLTAQSIIENMPLVSRDSRISVLGAQIVW